MSERLRRADFWLIPFALLFACSEPQAPPGPSVISAPARAASVLLITVDTLRADRLGVYGHPLDTSPNIDALARRGALFDDSPEDHAISWVGSKHEQGQAFPIDGLLQGNFEQVCDRREYVDGACGLPDSLHGKSIPGCEMMSGTRS